MVDVAGNPVLAFVTPWAPNFAPRSWALCQGQLLSISQNNALFALLGTIYGGDGRTTFGLPDLRGRVAVGAGSGPGLGNQNLGGKAGQQTVVLTPQQLASHTHALTAQPSLEIFATTGGGNQQKPSATHRLASVQLTAGSHVKGYSNAPTNTEMGGLNTAGALATENTGGNGAHDNMQSFLTLNYIICLAGFFPSRN